tara:strand:- start:305 stop:2194 length:1890 start_codon:yes stop_codon:yes gene_type:complete
MPLQKFIFNPGINKEGTDYSAEGGWFDGNLVRFRKGFPEKIGGWQKYIQSSYEGTGRKLHGWVNLEGTKLLGLGTRFKLYIQEGTTYNDVTPIRSTTSAGDVTFAATNGSSTLTVTDASHGAAEGDFVTFSGAASLGGNVIASVLNQEYQIESVPTVNTYTVVAKDTSGDTVTANSSDSGNGGSSVVGAYQINSGLDVFVDGTGWGTGSWGSGSWGSTTSLTDSNQLRLWSMDNFGEDLISNPRGGSIYYWDNSDGLTTRAVALTALSGANLAPTKGLQVIVSDVDRHVLILGADPINAAGSARTGSIDPLLIAFSDQENAAEWEPKSTNTAGSLRCSAGSEIIGGLRARQETLIWTDTALYSLQFIGPPLTFGLNLINEGVSLVGPNAAINTPQGIFWMSKKGFYSYSGAVNSVPCSVHSYVFDDINEGQSFQFFAFLNKKFNEVGWFYCSEDSTSIDRFVAYNYVEQTWNIGQLSRTAWLDEGIVAFPRAAGKASSVPYLYQHETGHDDDGSPMDNVFIESADFDIGEGEEFQFIKRMIPDVKFTGSGGSEQQINVVLKQRNFPGSSLTTDQTSSFTATTTKIDMRARARQAVIRFESDDDAANGVRLGVGFRVGGTRLDIRPNGRR